MKIIVTPTTCEHIFVEREIIKILSKHEILPTKISGYTVLARCFTGGAATLVPIVLSLRKKFAPPCLFK